MWLVIHTYDGNTYPYTNAYETKKIADEVAAQMNEDEEVYAYVCAGNGQDENEDLE